MNQFVPKSFTTLRSGYSFELFRKDLLAGIAVGIIALPLSLGFAIASGTSPERGLVTAIIAGFLISLFGGSRIQIGGPTGAFVVIIFDIIQKTGYEGLAISTIIASVILILLGVFKLGSLIKFVPYPLVTGFTTGIAVIIFSSQVKSFFQLSSQTALPTLLLAGSTMAVILLIRRFIPKLPWGIGAIVFATTVSYFLKLPVETIQTQFGSLPSHLPWPNFPTFYIAEGKLSEIVMNGAVIAFLAAIESLLSAVIGDGMIGSKHRSNCELIAQGIANFGSILFGGIPATGAIARTASNVKLGGQTPVSGMIHAATLMMIVLFLSPVVSQIPIAALAAILIMVAWNMSEIGHFLSLLKGPIGDASIMLSAFFLTVFVDITVAITVGMILALLLFMKRMSELSKTVAMTSLFKEAEMEAAGVRESLPDGVEAYEIQGPFFFGAADMLKDLLTQLEKPPQVFILRMKNVPFIDASGVHALKEFQQKCKRSGTRLIFTGVHDSIQREVTSIRDAQ